MFKQKGLLVRSTVFRIGASIWAALQAAHCCLYQNQWRVILTAALKKWTFCHALTSKWKKCHNFEKLDNDRIVYNDLKNSVGKKERWTQTI